MANKSGGNPLSARASAFPSLMRDHRDPARPQRPSRIPLETARMASEIRWLALSDGLRFCLRLPREDPRFEEELKRVLERAEQSKVLSVDDVELLEAAAAGSTLDLRTLADSVVERARRQLRVPSARSLRRDPSRTHARPQTRPAARLLVVAAATAIALAVSVVGARGDSWPDRTPAVTPARSGHPPAPAQSLNRCPIPAPLRDAFVTAARRTQLPLPLLVAVARSRVAFRRRGPLERGRFGCPSADALNGSCDGRRSTGSRCERPRRRALLAIADQQVWLDQSRTRCLQRRPDHCRRTRRSARRADASLRRQGDPDLAVGRSLPLGEGVRPCGSDPGSVRASHAPPTGRMGATPPARPAFRPRTRQCSRQQAFGGSA